MNKKSLRIVGLIFLILSAILFAFLGIISMWGDLEAVVFNSAIKSNKPLTSLRCPIVITPDDNAYVSARIHNSSDRELEMEIRTRVSDGSVVLMKEFTTNFVLKSGESEVVHVPISTADAAFDRVVLVRMHQISRGPLPYLNASCGIVVFNIPHITGNQFVILILILGTLFSAAGMTLWVLNAKPIEGNRLKTFRFLLFFTILACLLVLSGLFGWWMITLFLAIIWILLGMGKASQVVLNTKVNQRSKNHRN